jgi:hypothetical protein
MKILATARLRGDAMHSIGAEGQEIHRDKTSGNKRLEAGENTGQPLPLGRGYAGPSPFH